MDLTSTLRSVDVIEEILRSNTYGWRNEDALKAIEAEVFKLKTGRGDGYILEKVSSIETYANILYSPRRADKWGGGENVRSQMYASCQNIRSRAATLDRENEDHS